MYCNVTHKREIAVSILEELPLSCNYRRRIDYVFIGSRHVHPDAQCRIINAGLAFQKPVDGIWLSDHFGIVVDLDISKNKSKDESNN